jgi:hypothetical protein
MSPDFEQVEETERRFHPMARPEHLERHGLTVEQLSKVDEVTADRWILQRVMANKIDWLIDSLIRLHNDCIPLEVEVIKSRKFRAWLWARIAVFTSLGGALGGILAQWLLK